MPKVLSRLHFNIKGNVKGKESIYKPDWFENKSIQHTTSCGAPEGKKYESFVPCIAQSK